MISDSVYKNIKEIQQIITSTKFKGTSTQIDYRGNGDKIKNLNMELHPIGYYINDKKEMINQMFSVMKPNKLRAMLPPILQETSVEELKICCLNELLGMSWKHINCILEGWELQTSSDCESEIESSKSENNISSPMKNKNQRCNVKWKLVSHENYLEEANKDDDVDKIGPGSYRNMLEKVIADKEIELLNSVPIIKKNEHKRRSEYHEPSDSCSKKCAKKSKKLTDKCEFIRTIDISNKKSDSKRFESEAEVNTESKVKTFLEILELEMRARAIRAMLKQYASPDEENNEKGSNGSSADQHA